MVPRFVQSVLVKSECGIQKDFHLSGSVDYFSAFLRLITSTYYANIGIHGKLCDTKRHPKSGFRFFSEINGHEPIRLTNMQCLYKRSQILWFLTLHYNDKLEHTKAVIVRQEIWTNDISSNAALCPSIPPHLPSCCPWVLSLQYITICLCHTVSGLILLNPCSLQL